MRYHKAIGAMGLLVFVSCTGADDLPQEKQKTLRVLETAGAFASYDAHRPNRTTGEVADRALVLTAIIDPATAATHELLTSAFEQATSPPMLPAWFVHPIPRQPDLAVVYYRETDDLRVSDMALVRDYDSPASVDEKQAREMFHRTFDALASAGLVERNAYDLAREHVGYTKHGSGSTVNGVTTESPAEISEYHFRVRRLIDNIEFANELVKISVHVTGRISRIRVVGAEVGARLGELKERTLADADLRSRFSKDYPNGFAEWDQLLYSFQGDEQSGVIEPRHVFSFSTVTESDGEPIVSRRREVRYSITSKDEEPEIWPIAKPDAVGDPRTR